MGLTKPCKLWTGSTNRPGGYGEFRIKGKKFYIHRKTWEDAHGPIPKGIRILHKCDTPACYEITHLFDGTQAANQWDMVSKGRSAKGSRHSQAKLVEAEVLAIRRDPRPAKIVAQQYGISDQTVRDVKYRTWRHI